MLLMVFNAFEQHWICYKFTNIDCPYRMASFSWIIYHSLSHMHIAARIFRYNAKSQGNKIPQFIFNTWLFYEPRSPLTMYTLFVYTQLDRFIYSCWRIRFCFTVSYQHLCTHSAKVLQLNYNDIRFGYIFSQSMSIYLLKIVQFHICRFRCK